MEEVKWRSY